jgi:5'-deoxynucleotidase YfbR-like HD superfamily hydrolase
MDAAPENLEEQLRQSPIPFLSEISALKHLDRTGWKRFIRSPESVASHSFRVALLGLFAPVRFHLRMQIIMFH